MNIWLKPLIAFAVGIILGIGGMYLVGIRPTGNSAVCEGVPNVAGISGRALAVIKDNKAVDGAEIKMVLSGSIADIKDNTISLVAADNPPITVQILQQTAIFEPPEGGSSQPKILRLEDLKVYDVVRVFATIQGDQIVADSIILQGRPSPIQ